MAKITLSVGEIKELMEKMNQTGVSKLNITDGDYSVSLSSQKAAQEPEMTLISTARPTSVTQNTVSEVVAASEVSSQTVSQTLTQSAPADIVVEGNIITSPLVGTFYEGASPDKPPFVTVGSKVKKNDVLFVVESMKLMNEVQSEFDGEVVAINVKNSQAVEYGQSIMVIK